jgi:hypothetical protein
VSWLGVFLFAALNTPVLRLRHPNNNTVLKITRLITF